VIRATLAILLVSTLATAGVLPPDSTDAGRRMLAVTLADPAWEITGTGRIRAYAPYSWGPEARAAVAAAEAALPAIAAAVHVRPESVLPIWILITHRAEKVAREAPAWSAAIAQPATHLVVLSGPLMRRSRLDVAETVAHELAHLALGARLGETGWAPRWFDEGLAMHLSGYARLSDRWAGWGRGPVRLRDLTDAFPVHATLAHQAYLESAAAVRRIAARGALPALVDGLARGEEFEDAFAAAYGAPLAGFLDEIDAEVSRRARWFSLATRSVSLGGVMTLLVIVGGIVRRRRNRRRAREWEAHEAGETQDAARSPD